MNRTFSKNSEAWHKAETRRPSSAVTSSLTALQNHFTLEHSPTISTNLKAVNTDVLDAAKEEFANVINLTAKKLDEVNIVQPFVRRVIAAALRKLGKPDYCYSVNGSKFIPTRQRITDDSLVKESRVYC